MRAATMYCRRSLLQSHDTCCAVPAILQLVLVVKSLCWYFSADAQSSSIMAENVRQAMEQIELPVGKITVSIGGITLIPEGQYSLEQAMETADQLLYEAKQSGRNRVCWQSRLN